MKTSLVLLPGLGADATLFSEQRKHWGERLITPEWITPLKNESLVEFSQRFAQSLLSNSLAQLNEVFLGGFSFGGMVALELAHILSKQKSLKVRGVILISSGRTGQILSRRFRLQASVGALLPDWILKWIVKEQMLNRFVTEEILAPEQEAHLKTMVDNLDLHFFKWALAACRGWNPQLKFAAAERGFPIFEVQGESDQIIPLSTEEGVVTLKAAKHLIQYTHAREINQWIDQITQNG